jgi:hypothetical protein
MGMPNHPNQMMRCHDLHDRNGLTVGPCAFRGRELHEPLHQKLLPRGETRVKQNSILVSIAGAATRAVLIAYDKI